MKQSKNWRKQEVPKKAEVEFIIETNLGNSVYLCFGER
jgi:hypothetical protein